MSVELTITIRDEEGKKLIHPYLIYEDVTLKPQNPLDDPVISKAVKELLEEFEGEPDDIKLRATMVLK